MLKFGFCAPEEQELEIGVLFSLRITFQSGSRSHFKEKFLGCKIGKRLILALKRVTYISESGKTFNDKFSKINALSLHQRELNIFLISNLFYPPPTASASSGNFS